MNRDKAKLSAEAGYLDSGHFEKNVPGFGTVSANATGLWANAVIEVPIMIRLTRSAVLV